MKNYIPNNKYDFEAVEQLKLLSFESVREDVPKLLEWLQDMNWPVAFYVLNYLKPYIHEMKHELLYILNSDDTMWQYWIINSLLAHSTQKLDKDIITAIKRIAQRPTKMEIMDYVDAAAKDLLDDKSLCE